MSRAWPAAAQASFDDLGTHLSQVTFCVVDLETTGGAETDSITEFGAVKVRGGEVLGEFQTLVNPRSHIPPLIAVLTGITNPMVAERPAAARRCCRPSWPSPRARSSWPTTPPFDVGFLRRACDGLGYPYPALAGDRHRGAGPADPAARRGAELPAGDPGPALPGRGDAEPPGPDRRAGHRRRAARADRAGRQPRRAHPRGPAGVHPAGLPAAAGQAHLGRRTCPSSPGSTCSSPSTTRPAARALRRQVEEHPATGCAATSPPPRSVPGSTRWSGWPPASRRSPAGPSCRPTWSSCD